MAEKLKIFAVETNRGVYITSHPDDSRYGDSNFTAYLFDGKHVESTFKQGWSKLDTPPKKVTHMQSQPNINHRFVLIDESLVSEKIPLEMTREQAGEVIDCQRFQWKPEYEIYQSLYLAVSDEQPRIEVNDEFDYFVLAVIDNIQEPQIISYPFEESRLYGQKGNIENKDVSHAIIDQIVYPAIAIHERPCQLSSKQTYNIVREYIKRNINPKSAIITSDYDFCFTVQKVIPLGTPYSYQYDKNDSIFGRKKRKVEMRSQFVENKKMVCFEMTSTEDNYKGYTPIKSFTGINENDLKEQIDSYLETLMAYINEPMKECPHCNGVGVLYNSEIEPVTAKG